VLLNRYNPRCMKHYFLPAILLLVLAGAATVGWLVYDVQVYMVQPLNLPARTIFTVQKGMTLSDISMELAQRGWLEKPYYLMFDGRRRKLATSIKAGEYELIPGMSPHAVLDLFVSGRVVQYSLTIPEGWNFRQILQVVSNHPILRKTLHASSQEQLMKVLGLEEPFLEGLFLPDTFHFPSGTTDVEFLHRSYRSMKSVLEEEWSKRDLGLPYENEYEALVMASIIEKETATEEERGRIGGVFVRRLDQNMKLQTDPTVIYAMGDTYDGNLRQRDLTIDSPFNTYLYRGLPPTPIASPGRASIRAALHPEPGESLYFVAMGDGRHYFSATLEEHNLAVDKYQKISNAGDTLPVQE